MAKVVDFDGLSHYDEKIKSYIEDEINEKTTAEIFIATYGTTTFSEISDALTANKEIICFKDNSIYRYVSRIGGAYRFNFIRDNGQYYFVQVDSSDVWGSGTADYVTANNYKTYVTNALAGSSPISLTQSEQATAQEVLGLSFGLLEWDE